MKGDPAHTRLRLGRIAAFQVPWSREGAKPVSAISSVSSFYETKPQVSAELEYPDSGQVDEIQLQQQDPAGSEYVADGDTELQAYLELREPFNLSDQSGSVGWYSYAPAPIHAGQAVCARPLAASNGIEMLIRVPPPPPPHLMAFAYARTGISADQSSRPDTQRSTRFFLSADVAGANTRPAGWFVRVRSANAANGFVLIPAAPPPRPHITQRRPDDSGLFTAAATVPAHATLPPRPPIGEPDHVVPFIPLDIGTLPVQLQHLLHRRVAEWYSDANNEKNYRLKGMSLWVGSGLPAATAPPAHIPVLRVTNLDDGRTHMVCGLCSIGARGARTPKNVRPHELHGS